MMLNNKKNKQHQGETKMRLSTGRKIERLALEYRLGFVNEAIQKHFENPRAYSKPSLKRLRAERTRIENKLK